MQMHTDQVPWLSLSEMASLRLPGLPATKQGLLARCNSENWLREEDEGQKWRKRSGRGGGFEFSPIVLPLAARVQVISSISRPVTEAVKPDETRRQDLWQHYETLTEEHKERAKHALDVLQSVEQLTAAGARKSHAIMMIANETGIGVTTIRNWYRDVQRLDRCDWLPALAPRYCGRPRDNGCDPDVWEMLKADYLRLERPTFLACYRRVSGWAKENSRQIPSARSLERDMQKLPPEVLILAREGEAALKRVYPAQFRDRSVFHALEAVNADGHRWDVFVRWPDGTIGRPVMVAFQDLYSGMMLSWRIDKSENSEAVRLAFGDMVGKYGIPKMCYLDNGRNFACKWLTGGVQNRFRFKIREDEPKGIMVQMGVDVRFTTPYSGQSKPIERGFRDFAQDIARHPAFSGAWTGNTPMAKPENYGNSAVDLDVFVRTIAEGVREHNERIGRRSTVCSGRSFADVFRESYARSAIVQATAEQQRLWLMTASSMRVRRQDGVIEMLGNRYWSEEMTALRGQTVIVRFDPQDLHGSIFVYRQDGVFVSEAKCHHAAGFSDRDAAQEHGRARRRHAKATKEILAAEKTMSAQKLSELYASVPEVEEETVERKIVRPFRPPALVSHGNAALSVLEDEDEAIAREEAENAAYDHMRRVLPFRKEA